MGFHLYTDGFWQKHAVTAQATIVEAKRGKPGGDSWMHLYWWTLVADVSDPETGQIVRAEGSSAHRPNHSTGTKCPGSLVGKTQSV